MKTYTEQEALYRCAAYCSLAERCTQDVRKKMDPWAIPSEAQQRVISQLQKEGFLNEERFCKAFVNDKTRFARWGKNKIVYALKAKGIGRELIAKAVSEIDDEQTEEMVEQLLKKKLPSVKGKDNYEIRIKLMRFAAGRGFELSVITRCLDRIL